MGGVNERGVKEMFTVFFLRQDDLQSLHIIKTKELLFIAYIFLDREKPCSTH